MNEIKYIGDITLKKLRDAILDFKIAEDKAILLHPNDFDDLAGEYRETYKESIPFPFFYLGVLVYFDEHGRVPLNRISITDNNINVNSYQNGVKEEEYPPFYEVYRCGWCGNVVAYDGSELDYDTRREHIRIIEKYKNEITHIKVHGKCCPNGDLS